MRKKAGHPMFKKAFVAAVVLGTAARVHAGCNAQLTLADATTLPGIPVRAFVTLTNSSNAVQPLPGSVAVLTGKGEQGLFLLKGAYGYASYFPRRGDAPLAPHETRVVSLGYDAAVFA